MRLKLKTEISQQKTTVSINIPISVLVVTYSKGIDMDKGGHFNDLTPHQRVLGQWDFGFFAFKT